MDRREFMRRASLACAVPFALQGGFAWAADSAANAPLTADEMALIGAIAEGIIPATDTPGAKGAGVPQFIGMLYSDWFLPPEHDGFKAGLAAFDSDARTKYQKRFVECSTTQQNELLTLWDATAAAAAHSPNGPTFFGRLKQLVAIGYYTSQTGYDTELKMQFGAGQDLRDGPVLGPPPFRI